MTTTLAINAGGPTVGNFLTDDFFIGGGTFGPSSPSISPIDLSGVTDPAPEEVYQTERTGQNNATQSFTYVIDGLVPNDQYELRLHFAEIFFEQAGARLFDIELNGTGQLLLDDYDVFVESGDTGTVAERAVIEEFTVNADANGVLTLNFTASVNNAKLSALELTGDIPFPIDPPDPPVSEPSPFQQVADTPIAVFEGQGAATDDGLYVIGGFINGLNVTTESHFYDPAADVWTRIADFPEITEEIVNFTANDGGNGVPTGTFVTGGITHGATVVDGDNLYVVGGYVGPGSGQATSVVSVYDTETDTWTRGTSLPGARGGGGAAIVGRQLHYFGGGTRTFGQSAIFDQPEHWVLDLGATDSPDDDGVWTPLADLPTLRNHSAGASIDGIVYAIGGQAGADEVFSNQVALEAFDPATGQWTSRADIPIPLGHIMASVAVADGQLIVVGGVTNEGNPEALNGSRRTATVFSYDPGLDEWRQLDSLPAERQSPVAGVVGDQLIVAAGLSAGIGGGFQQEVTTFVTDVNELLAEPPSVLFVRGADRSGGFFEATNDFDRTEQLSDIFNASTSGGNHGWNELRLTLEGAGFNVEQITEGVEAGNTTGQSDGVHIDFESLDLSQHDAIVFGSNNAVYDTAAVDAIEDYIRGGGGALFISDANFGSDWADASNSDQQFLDRFGLRANQDQGTYSITRADGEFLVPDSPLFEGVDQFDGEGVTPIQVINPQDFDVDVTILALAEGSTRLNEPPLDSNNNNQGPSRAAGPTDAAVLTAEAGAGRIVGHFDRNTFFNDNGAGTNINRFDNQQYALNLFSFLVGGPDPLPGDYDGSGVVDAQDHVVFTEAFGATGANSADGNGDLLVNAADFTIFRDNVVTPAAAASAPVASPAESAGPVGSLGLSTIVPSPVSDAGAEEAAALAAFDAGVAEDDTLLLLAARGVDPAFGAGDGVVDRLAEAEVEEAADEVAALDAALDAALAVFG